MNDESKNCAGCKWLDQENHSAKGNGYCCMVQLSKDYKAGYRARFSGMIRCELYEKGSFETRYSKKGTLK